MDEKCVKCDRLRDLFGEPSYRIGRTCDICDGRGVDFLGRKCRHLPHDQPLNLDDA